jgi:hypothetical protein
MVQVYNVWDIENEVPYKGNSPYSDKGIEIFKKWCKANGYHFYAKSKENFSVHEAVKETKELGLFKVIVNNLS